MQVGVLGNEGSWYVEQICTAATSAGHNAFALQFQQLRAGVTDNISHLHIALSGFIAATGLAIAALSWFGVRRGERWAFAATVTVTAVSLAISVPAHYPWGLATLGHLGPVYLAVLIFLAGAATAYSGMRGPSGESS